MFQSRRVLIWHEKELLNDGFFSFAVVRQIEDTQYSITSVSSRPSGNV
jgi:hypothetical protein